MLIYINFKLKSPGQPQCSACVCLRFCYVVGQRQPFLWPRKWRQQLRKVTEKRKQKRAMHCGWPGLFKFNFLTKYHSFILNCWRVRMFSSRRFTSYIKHLYCISDITRPLMLYLLHKMWSLLLGKSFVFSSEIIFFPYFNKHAISAKGFFRYSSFNYPRRTSEDAWLYAL
jgi:hypothetical protein